MGDESLHQLTPDAHVAGKRNPVVMLTTDLSLREDPAYRKISEKFAKDPDAFNDAFARAWFKLTHRDMGPTSRYVGAEVPSEVLIWQDPVPAVDYTLINDSDVASLKKDVLASGLSVSDLGSSRILPRYRHARWCQWRPPASGPAERLGGQ
jgi:catalase-peroxidase